MNLPQGIWTATSPVTKAHVDAARPLLERAAAAGWPKVIVDWTEWQWQPMEAETDPEELPDKLIVPDEADPLPPDELVKTDPLPPEPESYEPTT